MTEPDFSQFRSTASALADKALVDATVGAPGCITQGVPAARLLLKDDPSLYPSLVAGFKHLATPSPFSPPRVTDPAGHYRDVYHPLLLHLYLAAFLRRYESLPSDLWGSCESAVVGAAETQGLSDTTGAVDPVRTASNYTDAAPAPPLVPLVLWQALCLFEQSRILARDVDAEIIDAVVHQIVAHPGPDATLHARSDEESADAWAYRELVGLHALANLALGRQNSSWARRVEQIAMYHVQHTQPDHVTNQPWALFAFAWSPHTASFAEQQLHDVNAGGSGRVGPVQAMILADAIDAFGRFQPR